ncbi:MAG TPA: FHA domain-containing protein, partial [Tepidisphaeraceae bacterium]|nr:FHA domain-containing protein [Tepidisphaeraceae bacterium]
SGPLSGRVLIGRWPGNTVVIDDKSVSRIHAWIGLQDGEFYVADAGSRTGTFINGMPLQDRHVLQDDDQIRVGNVTLCYRIGPTAPPGVEEIDLSPRPPTALSGAHGRFMDCVCGAPIWMPLDFIGVGQCRYCGHTIRAEGGQATPTSNEPLAGPAPPASDVESQKEQVCGVCHNPIADFDDTKKCPSCGLAFHADCWQENRGCSAYGCPQVGALEAHQ